jgi:glutaredoxin
VLFTWVDEKGSFHLAEAATDVPAPARKQVRVVVDGKSVGSPQYVYVADLTETHEGKYPLLSMPRTEWESIGKAGREQQVAELRPKEEPSAQGQLADLQVDAIIYGADWCKPCHLAEDYLKSKGKKVIKKDIEEDPKAAEEMQAVLKSAGLSGSSIPVLNVGGTILRGFSAKAIDAALARSKKP